MACYCIKQFWTDKILFRLFWVRSPSFWNLIFHFASVLSDINGNWKKVVYLLERTYFWLLIWFDIGKVTVWLFCSRFVIGADWVNRQCERPTTSNSSFLNWNLKLLYTVMSLLFVWFFEYLLFIFKAWTNLPWNVQSPLKTLNYPPSDFLDFW